MVIYIVTLCFILFDSVTGIIKALYNKKLNSTALRKGLFHKLAEVNPVLGKLFKPYLEKLKQKEGEEYGNDV